jgi:hypothetical protein
MHTFTTTLELEEAKMYIQNYLTQQRGYVLSYRDGNSLTFTKTQKPSVIAFFVLLLFFVIPAILYLVLAWKKKTCSVFFKKEKDGTKVTVDGISGRSLVKHLVKYDDTLKALPEGKFSMFWDVPVTYVAFGIAAVFMFFILILKGVGAL